MQAEFISLQEYQDYDSAYWALGATTDNVLYFGLCSHVPQKSASLFSLERDAQKVKQLVNLGEVLKIDSARQVQGKIHTPIFEGSDKKLYFGTHFAYPMGVPQEINYEGGRFLSYDHATGQLEDFGVLLPDKGILTMALDPQRMVAYMMTAPAGNFLVYDIRSRRLRDLGALAGEGSVCRSLAIDDKGNVYGAVEPNRIFVYDVTKQAVEFLSVQLPDAKTEEWSSPSRGGVNKIGRNIWRCVVWDEVTKRVYGIHAATSKLFSFDPATLSLESLDFMGSDTFRDRPSDIYPTLSLAVHKGRLFYTPAGGFFDYARSEKITEMSHLISLDTTTRKKVDHGILESRDGRKVYGTAGSVITPDGFLYLLGAVEGDAKASTEDPLFSLDGKPMELALIGVDTNRI